jgi:hypothetical protein
LSLNLSLSIEHYLNRDFSGLSTPCLVPVCKPFRNKSKSLNRHVTNPSKRVDVKTIMASPDWGSEQADRLLATQLGE